MLPTSGLLEPAIANITGAPLSTVRRHAQRLREGGMLSVSGRGSSAALWEISDAINVVISICCSETHSEAVEIVEKVRAAKLDRSRSILDDCVARGLRIADAQTAGEALEGLVADVMASRLDAHVALDFVNKGDVVSIGLLRSSEQPRMATYIYGSREPVAPLLRIARVEDARESLLKPLAICLWRRPESWGRLAASQ